MKRGEFIIGGMPSSEINSLIQQRPEVPTPARKIQRRSAPGVSGNRLFDEEAYENTEIPLELFTKGTSEQDMRDLKDKITYAFDSGGYIDFVPYWNPDMIYQVEAQERPLFMPDGNIPIQLNYSVTLSVKPFAHAAEIMVRDATESLTLYNPNYYASKPTITLYGTGDMKVHVNGKEFVFQEIDEHVIIESETENAYKEIPGDIISRNHRMYTIDFPVLQPGENTIEITGDATHFEIEPRWQKLVN